MVRREAERHIKDEDFQDPPLNIESKFLLYDYHEFFKTRGYILGKVYPGYVEFREYDMSSDEDFIGPNYVAVNADLKEKIHLLGN